jgi:general secretion pathway protein A
MSQFGTYHPAALPSPGRSSLLTYEPYFGLREKPFSLSSDPRFLYRSPMHAPVFEDLRAGIRRREGLIVLTGDIGTGKTTLCKAVVQDLDRKTFSAFVPDPFLSREDLLKMLLLDFGVVSVDDLRSGRLNGASRPDLSYPLYDFLKTLVPLQAFAVVIIDEAQNLSVPLLEEIRILSDLEAPEKLLQVVLVGQLELHAKLKLPEMRQVDQRISVRCELEPMNRDMVAGYIAHRMDVAGGGRERGEFSVQAIDEIYRMSKGVPRVVNLICDRSLHHAYLERASRIEAPHVVRATVDLGLRKAVDVPAPIHAAAPARPKPAPAGNLEDLLNSTHDALTEEVTLDEQPLPSDETPLSHPASDVTRTFLLETSSLDDHPSERWTGERARRRVRAAAIGAVMGALLVGAVLTHRAYGTLDATEGATLPRLPATPDLTGSRSSNSLLMHVAASIAMAESPAVYAIDVAAFENPVRSANLISQLSAAGYHAYAQQRQVGEQSLHVVRVGPYIVLADADTDLTNIRKLPGYADARVSAVFADTP